jgi:hypothetical protein
VRDVKHALNNHVQTTEIYRKQTLEKMDSNHESVSEKIDQIQSGLKWAGTLIITLLLSVLGWSVLQQINANEAQKAELQNQIELLRASQRADNLSVQNARLQAGTSEAAGEAISDGQNIGLGH